MKTAFKTVAILVLTILFILASIRECQEWKENRQLKAKHEKAFGLIVDFGSSVGKAGDIPAKYVFDVNGRKFEGFF